MHGPAPLPAPSPAARRKLSLRHAAILFVVCLNVVLCSAVAAVLVVNARWAVEEEVASALALAEAHLRRQVAELRPDITMYDEAAKLAHNTDATRHVSATILDLRRHPPPERPAATRRREEPPASPAAAAPELDDLDEEEAAPAWFARLVSTPGREVEFPVVRYPNIIGTIRLSGNPTDEIAEVWEDFSIIIPVLVASGIISLTLTLGVLFALLRRIQGFLDVVERLQRGELSARVPAHRLDELAALGDGINALAAHLADEHAKGKELKLRLLAVSEEERRQIASELHDGMGPSLFALRTALCEAEDAARELPPPGRERLLPALASVARHATALQGLARATIFNLRPLMADAASIEEIYLEVRLHFRETAPAVEFDLDCDPARDRMLSAVQTQSVYRFVQESVLNAVRHGGARTVTMRVTLATGGGFDNLTVAIEDDGRGPSNQGSRGPRLGQLGILDRMEAIGGTYSPPTRRGDRTVTDISLTLGRAGGVRPGELARC